MLKTAILESTVAKVVAARLARAGGRALTPSEQADIAAVTAHLMNRPVGSELRATVPSHLKDVLSFLEQKSDVGVEKALSARLAAGGAGEGMRPVGKWKVVRTEGGAEMVGPGGEVLELGVSPATGQVEVTGMRGVFSDKGAVDPEARGRVADVLGRMSPVSGGLSRRAPEVERVSLVPTSLLSSAGENTGRLGKIQSGVAGVMKYLKGRLDKLPGEKEGDWFNRLRGYSKLATFATGTPVEFVPDSATSSFLSYLRKADPAWEAGTKVVHPSSDYMRLAPAFGKGFTSDKFWMSRLEHPLDMEMFASKAARGGSMAGHGDVPDVNKLREHALFERYSPGVMGGSVGVTEAGGVSDIGIEGPAWLKPLGGSGSAPSRLDSESVSEALSKGLSGEWDPYTAMLQKDVGGGEEARRGLLESLLFGKAPSGRVEYRIKAGGEDPLSAYPRTEKPWLAPGFLAGARPKAWKALLDRVESVEKSLPDRYRVHNKAFDMTLDEAGKPRIVEGNTRGLSGPEWRLHNIPTTLAAILRDRKLPASSLPVLVGQAGKLTAAAGAGGAGGALAGVLYNKETPK